MLFTAALDASSQVLKLALSLLFNVSSKSFFGNILLNYLFSLK